MQTLLVAVTLALCSRSSADTVTTVGVQLDGPTSPLQHFWKASVGSGHAKLGLRDDWRQQLAAVHTDLGITGVRFHGSFDDDMGPVITGDPTAPTYNFTLLDQLYDGIQHAGVTPIVELSFMPRVIANCPRGKCQTTMHYEGVTEPPIEWSMWQDLVAAFAQHMVDRYTLDVVATFKFEVWNELWGMPFGSGKIGDSQYMAMYNASYHALKGVSPRLQVGGPATMEVQHVDDFIAALKTWHVDADFVSTHLYPTDWCNSAPDARTHLDCFTDNILEARQKAKGYPFLMTEYNCGWKDTEIHDGESTSYAASFALRTVNALKGQVDALSWWTFSSIFEEGGLPTNEFGPFGANSAMQTVHGVPMPVYRGFQLLASAGNVTLPVTMDGLPSVNGTSTTLSVMATATVPASFHHRKGMREEDEESGRGSVSVPVTVYLANFAPDDGKGIANEFQQASHERRARKADTAHGLAANPHPNPHLNPLAAPPPPTSACNPSEFLANTDFPGSDLLPESQKFTTPNASACCLACKNYQVDKFCAVWSWGLSGGLNRCYLKSAEALSKKTSHPGFTAGYPGAPPPPPSNKPWYNTTRVVKLQIPQSHLARRVVPHDAVSHDDAGMAAAAVDTVQVGTATVSVVNSTCANPKAAWINMGSPTWPSDSQMATLHTASQLCVSQVPFVSDGHGNAVLTVTLEPYAAVSVAFDGTL
eukprot:m.121546 g.121546  ORF g.121546 m.121546 type:complete len:703 (+) comp11087_c2_seq2:78-2186(+)